MNRKYLMLIFLTFLCLPLFADPQVIINTDVTEGLVINKFYQEIGASFDITDGSFFIDTNGIHSSLSEANAPFDVTQGFTTNVFIIAFMGTVLTTQSHQISVETSSYYLIDNSNKIYVSQTPLIINKSPSDGILTFESGQYYDDTNVNAFTFQIQSPAFNTIGAGRYYTDITISLVEN